MGNAKFNINSSWKNINKIYIKTDPTAPVINFDETNDPFDRDESFKTHLMNNGTNEGFNYTNVPQGNTVLMPDFTLGDKFDIAFRFKGSSSTANDVACIFTNQHDRQGFFNDNVFAIYQPPINQGHPSDTVALHFAPLNDPNGHQRLKLTRRRIKVTYVFSGGASTLVFDFAGQHNNKAYYEFLSSGTAQGFGAGMWRLVANANGDYQLSTYASTSTSPSDTIIATQGYLKAQTGYFSHEPTSVLDIDVGQGDHLLQADLTTETVNDYYVYFGSGDQYTKVVTQANFGGVRLLFRGLLDGNFHNFRFSYDNGQVSATMDDDDANFQPVTFLRDTSSSTAVTSVPHGGGYPKGSAPRLMSSFSYWSSYINTNGFNSESASTPRFNGYNGTLGNFKLTLYPNNVKQVFADYKMKDGVQSGTQIIKDDSTFHNDGELVYATDINIADIWDFGDGTTVTWKEIGLAYAKVLGEWRCIFNGRILLSIDVDTADYDLFQAAGSPTVDVKLDLHIAQGVNVYSTSINNGAIYGSGNFTAGSDIRIYNRGQIYGKGGDGGSCPYFCGRLVCGDVDKNNFERTVDSNGNYTSDAGDYDSFISGAPFILDSGGSRSDCESGENGGSAIELCGNIKLYNLGKLYGGGGGSGAVRAFNFAKKGKEDYGAYFLDWSFAGGGGAGYIGGTGGSLTKKTSALDWSRPSSILNDNGTKFGAGSSDVVKAPDGSKTLGGRNIVGNHRSGGQCNFTFEGKGGGLDQAGSNRRTSSIYVHNGYGCNYEIVGANGRQGARVDTKGFTLTQAANTSAEGRQYVPVSSSYIYDTVTNTNIPQPVSTGTLPVFAPVPRKKVNKWGFSILCTACQHHKLISKQDLKILTKWRATEEKRVKCGEKIFAGYLVSCNRLANKMTANKKVAALWYALLVADLLKLAKGEIRMPIRYGLLKVIGLLTYIFRRRKCLAALELQMTKGFKNG